MSGVEEADQTSVDLGRRAAMHAESRMLIDGSWSRRPPAQSSTTSAPPPAWCWVAPRPRTRRTWTGPSPRPAQRLRRNRLVDQPRAAQALPGTAAGGDRGRQGELREELIAEVGCPVMTTAIRPTGLAAGRSAALPRPADRRLRVGAHARRRRTVRRAQRANRRQGAGRRRRRDHAVQLPDRGHPQQARPRACHRQHRRAQTGPEHAVERNAAGPVDRRAHRHPRGRGERRPDPVQRRRRQCWAPTLGST